LSKELNKLKVHFRCPTLIQTNNKSKQQLQKNKNEDAASLIFPTQLGFIVVNVIQGPFPPQSIKKVGP